MEKIAIIGLGYIGLPLSLQFARSCAAVIGIDIDSAKISALSGGKTYIKHIPDGAIQEALASGKFTVSTDFGRVKEVESVVVCVPTPLTKTREPDLSYVLDTGRAIAPHLQRGTLVVLESTTYPGTTEEDLRAILEEGSGMKAGEDFHLAFSPEREDPGNPDSKVAKSQRSSEGTRLHASKKPLGSTHELSILWSLYHRARQQRPPSYSKTFFGA